MTHSDRVVSSSHRQSPIYVAALAGLLALSLATVAQAATPTTMLLEGVLQAAAGPASDGAYDVTIRLWAAETGGTALWTEGPTSVQVTGGRFAWAMGGKTPLDATALGQAKWISVQVGSDPELPRRPLHAAPFARQAAVAEVAALADVATTAKSADTAKALACTGCVAVGALKFDGDLDLGGNSVKAKNGTFSGDLVAKSVSATAFVGDGSKLTGVQVAGGSCKTGEVVTGVQSDGSVTCGKAAGGGTSALGGLLSQIFSESALAPGLPTAIPDNTGATATAQLAFEKVGDALSLLVEVEASNTDLSTVSVVLLPPWDKAKGFILCDPCGDKDSKTLKLALKDADSIKTGNLADAVGKPLEGTWTLKVTDTSFCIPQAPGNATLCDPGAKTDGAIALFRITGTVQSTGSVLLKGSMQFQPLDAPPFACTAARAGHAYFDGKGKKLRFCDGTVWRSLSDGCGNGVLELGEDCDDGNNQGGDGCSETCTLVCGDGFVLGNESCDDGNSKDGDGCSAGCALELGLEAGKPAASCKALRAVGAAKDGAYWIDPDGNGALAAQQLWCDMTTAGGGWTIVYAATGADGEQPATGNSAKTGKPMALEHYNLPRAEKVAISGAGSETLLWRSKDVWLRVSHVPFDGKLNSGGVSKWSATVTASSGQTSAGQIGFSTTNINGGGDFGVTNGAGFDHHSSNYYMLNGGCANHFLYSYSNASGDGDAGYDVNTALGSWTATVGCGGDEGGQLKFYMAVR